MEIVHFIKDEISSLDKEKRSIFLEYFTKSVEEITENWGFSCEWVDNGNEEEYYISNAYTTLQDESSNNEINLKFISIWKKGIIESIEVQCDDLSNNWTEIIKNKVTQSLASAFGQKVESFFFRKKYYYKGNPLDGDYYIHNWRISPASPSRIFYAESVINFDMNVEGINKSHAYSVFDRFSKEVMALLSVIFNKGIYENHVELRWAMENMSKSKLLFLGYYDDTVLPTEMPAKNKKKLGSFVEPKLVTGVKNYTDNLCPPNNIRKLIKAFQNLELKEKNAFLSASRMFQLALSIGNHIKTVNVSYQIAALDSLSKLIREDNKNKNAILSLINQYSPGDELMVGKMYDSIRSAHFHQGYFAENDIDGIHPRPFMGPEYNFSEVSFFLESNVTRRVLINWLSDRISH
ncbi:hypothetical protein B7492_31660 (plasmid) [Bacillus mycoides]|uniref:Apea-like HEPN domain-containing protein n=1 Tax=Bacillus mycoides TaxID=1405 RepID=A0A1W6AIE2_BACMY|nr:hypothetical protein [Bacillus mycoides]ARJ25592.1 hypothetical protein B7492_31660 [Bacillus mycoides]